MDEYRAYCSCLKLCSRCRHWKSLHVAFYRNARSPDGYRSVCRQCAQVYDQARYRAKRPLSPPSTILRRSRASIDTLDAKIRTLYGSGVGCRRIGEQLNEEPAMVYKRVRAMGLARSSREAQQTAPYVPVPFSRDVDPNLLRAAAIGHAVAWFLARGYTPSIPVEPAQYDLVVESDDGLQRVQVKSTTRRERSGRWCAGIRRQEYTPGDGRSRRGYRSDEIDLFFIVAGDGTAYLIPLDATGRGDPASA